MEITQVALLHLVLLHAAFSQNVPGFNNASPRNPALYYTTMELSCSDGYPIQEHTVVTEDGYILSVHRIPNGRRKQRVKRHGNRYFRVHRKHHPDFEDCVAESLNETSSGLPVVMAHGLIMASDGWLLQGPGYDLAYLLADAGYDVWMPNIRGNFYSRSHKTMDPSDPKFWDFSFHENAFYDLPAVIDYVLEKTQQKKTLYVGYSLGTIVFFTMTSMRPEFNDKILGFVGLAPPVYTKMVNASLRKKRIYNSIIQFQKTYKERKRYEVLPRNQRLMEVGATYCSTKSELHDLCYAFFSILMGDNTKLVLGSKLHLILTHVPAGTSLKTFEHLTNNILNSQLKKFDYGPKENFRLYGQPVPPDYPIWNVTVPVSLHCSDGDLFYAVKDVEFLAALLKNVVDVNVVKAFNHADFAWSHKAKDLVYPRVVTFLNRLRDEYYLRSGNPRRA